ncbi:MAG TPA: anthranilate phosphoribosyltransferase [Roseimicrobium sp.]|nr:anthranilate phosphoribosyltransferase [Roseimicrobium sp.]
MFTELTEQLRAGKDLADDQVATAVAGLADGTLPPEPKADFLTALAQKGESTAEIAAFARESLARSVQPVLHPDVRSSEILDVCGTGGDRLNTFNISTTVALIVASADVFVAKHGNRAITSQAGSADVLEALGIPIELTPEQAAASLHEHHFAFFFAPRYHPSFKNIAPARKLCAERGQRTIFNFLGPLLNPARPTAQLIGVPRPALCESMARVLQSLGIRRAIVACGTVPTSDGIAHLDELSTLGENHIAEYYQDRGFATSTLDPTHFPLQRATLADLTGAGRDVNADIVRQILKGTDRGPRRDAVLLNAAAALFVAGKSRSLADGWELAESLIDSGNAAAKLSALTGGKS